jgi:hypothetical protein
MLYQGRVLEGRHRARQLFIQKDTFPTPATKKFWCFVFRLFLLACGVFSGGRRRQQEQEHQKQSKQQQDG